MKLKITVDGKIYEVEVEVSEPDPVHPTYFPPQQARVPAAPSVVNAAPAQPVSSASGPVADESKVCRSPLAGFVSKVSSQVGQEIQANDVLLVLEAMKMETVITAPHAGKIAKINVGVSYPVQQGQVLVEFE